MERRRHGEVEAVVVAGGDPVQRHQRLRAALLLSPQLRGAPQGQIADRPRTRHTAAHLRKGFLELRVDCHLNTRHASNCTWYTCGCRKLDAAALRRPADGVPVS